MSLDVKWALAFVTVSTLGIVACTITSGTVDDTGIRGNGPDLDSGSAVGNDAETGANPTCLGNRQGVSTEAGVPVPLGNSAACQSCMEANCCTALTTCFNKVAPSADDGTCDDFQSCVESCLGPGIADPTNCRAGCDTAYPKFSTEWKAIPSCRNTSCASVCPALDLAVDGG